MNDFKTGAEWVVDAHGCNPRLLRDGAHLRKLLQEIVDDLQLKLAAPPVAHAFPGEGGVTIMLLLMESHLTVHTYPETAFAAFNLYCCRHRSAWPWESRLQEALGADAVLVRCLRRGGED
jgi:S-adenosylmethionine decarboxylase